MKKNSIYLGLITLILITGCAADQKQTDKNYYELNGELTGIENGTWISLMLDDEVADSTQVLENSFNFKGKLDHPKQYSLYIKGTRNIARIWLEPKKIKFKVKDGEFAKAKITGSKTQKEQDILSTSIKAYRSRRDSLVRVYRDPNTTDSLKKEIQALYNSSYGNRFYEEERFVKNNPASYVSAKVIDFYATTFEEKKTREFYNILSDSLKISSYGQSINRYLTLNKNLKVGDQYVNFSMNNDKGDLVNLSDFEGKLILLDFWASWCGPCIEEYPALKKAYSKFSADNFEIVSISEDQKESRWLEAIEKNELNWTNLWNERGNGSDPYLIYGVSGIPDNFLIDEKGTIIARNLRGDKLIETIETILKE